MFTQLRFTYEQENHPEEFFIPYVWQLAIANWYVPTLPLILLQLTFRAEGNWKSEKEISIIFLSINCFVETELTLSLSCKKMLHLNLHSKF